MRTSVVVALVLAALLLGAAVGWLHRHWTSGSIEAHTDDARRELKHKVEKMTR